MTTFDLTPAVVAPTARRWYRLPVLGFLLEVAPMSSANEPFWRAALKKATARQAAGLGGDDLTPEVVASGRRRDAELMAEYIVVGWRDVRNAAGEAVAFSREAVEELLMQLATTTGAGHLFDGLRSFAMDPANFTGSAVASAQALAGNSPGA